jgi:type II secretory pathway pseudopilin PulG
VNFDMKNPDMNNKSAGFTLVEVMVTLVIAMVILGGLLANFMSQSSQYKFQDKRVDASQDLEFAIRYIANDLQSALVSPSAIEIGGAVSREITGLSGGSTASSFLSFVVWDEANGTAPDFQVRRCYRFDAGMVKYDVDAATCVAGTVINNSGAIVGEVGSGLRGLKVTHFRVFQDGLNDADRANYTSIPAALPTKIFRNFNNDQFDMPAFTVLLEVEIDAVIKGSVTDVLGNAVTKGKRRIWRYIQVYPSVVLEE